MRSIRRTVDRWLWSGSALLVSVLVALLVLLPIVHLAVRGITQQQLSWLDLVLNADVYVLVARTLGLTVLVTGLATTIAVPSAYFTERTDLTFRAVWRVISVLPLAVPSYIGAYVYIYAAGPKGSPLQEMLAPLGVSELPSIRGWFGATFVLTLFTYPYIYLTVCSALRRMSPTLEEAARDLGASRWRAFRTVIFPRILPAMGAGSLLVALYTLSDFGAVSLLQFDSFTNKIYLEFNTFNQETAAFYSIVLALMAAVVVLFEWYCRNQSDRSERQPVNRVEERCMALGPWQWPAQLFFVLLSLLTVVVPVLVLGTWMWQGIVAGVSLHLEGAAALNSVFAAGVSGGLGVLIGLPVAYAAVSKGSIGIAAERLSYVGYAIPGIVVGVAFVSFSNTTPWLYQSLGLLFAAYVVRFVPQSIGAQRSTLTNVNSSVYEAGMTLGRSREHVFFHVMEPLLRPGYIMAFALVFLTTIKELPATLLLRPNEFDTLAIEIWTATREARFAEAGAHSLILILATTIVLAVVMNAHRFRPGGTSPAS